MEARTVDLFTGRRDEAIARMERAFAVISPDEPDEKLALLAVGLAAGSWFGGDLERSAERAELAREGGRRPESRTLRGSPVRSSSEQSR